VTPQNVERFLLAQNGQHPTHQASTYTTAIRELASGQKTSHWMWYVFPQIPLGSSSTAREFALTSMDEVVAFLQHPVLGTRYEECCELVLKHASRAPSMWKGIQHILGSATPVDSAKFRSSITLFGEAVTICPALGHPRVAAIWDAFSTAGVKPCPQTLDFIVASPPWCP
jgi:uncharacterized protein (DUF1810 family)